MARYMSRPIDLSAILRKSLDRVFFYTFLNVAFHRVAIRASIITVHIRKFYKTYQDIVRFLFFFRIAKRSIDDYAKDGGEELFTKMHCVLIPNP